MRRLIKFLGDHKTKLSGILLVAVGSLQTNAAVLQQVMSAQHFAYFTIGAGVLVAIIGTVNSAQLKKQIK